MKLSCDHSYDQRERGMVCYPISEMVASTNGHQLSYQARELACHSKDVYMERLKGIIVVRKYSIEPLLAVERSDHLMIHCHRAMVETILRKVNKINSY